MRSVHPDGPEAVDDNYKQQLVGDWLSAPLTPVDRVILSFVAKLTESPADIKRWDVEQLRLQGLDDRAIHDIVQVTAYFNYVNRLADGLGVELEA